MAQETPGMRGPVTASLIRQPGGFEGLGVIPEILDEVDLSLAHG
jgi:hypothetical protein